MNAAFNSKTEDSPRTSPDVSLEARLEAAARVSAAHFERMLDYLSYLPASDIELVRQAWHYADKAHTNQWRSSGDPYITHPIAVTTICAHWKLDAPALMAALLHDAMEDCGITKEDLADRFGPVVADLVDGLTKLDKLHFNTREESQAESFRKMLLAMAKDVRVILIKLADRTHNMRTMGDMPRSKWGRIASETLEIYAPIAHRLGLNQTYRELQDLSFHYQNPWRYATLEKAITKSRARRHDLVLRVQNEIAAEFGRVNMSVRLAGRESTLYSLYQKMLRHHLTFAQVTDIYGFRIIVPTVTDCYTALGILHQMYKPVPGKFKDHIAIAKSNGYQSLHTMLVGPSGVNIEFQIRTEPMHIVAEAGIAAHWLYKSQGKQESLNTKWLQSLLDIQTETNDATEFWDNVKVDLFPDSIYVFTPKSKIMAMPRGATVVDFAYAIHSNIGHHTVSALINGEPASLRTELKSGDVVQIITDDNATPNPVWLGFVKTGRARSKIRNYLKTAAHSESMVLGETLLTQALREEGIAAIPANDEANQPLWNAVLLKANSPSREDLLTDIGMGRQAAGWVARHFMALLASQGQRPDAVLLSQERFASSSQRSRSTVALDGNSNASVRYAACCRPVPGDAVVAYLGRGDGLHVHNAQCINAKRLQVTDSERLVPVEWAEDSSQKLYDSGLSVTIHNQKGVLARVATELSDANVDIRRLEMDDEAAMQTTELRFIVSVHNQQQVDAALRSLRRIPTVVRASRILPLE
ncbi:bifunctional (p)ppGpp synthetase/guanosine-3',5'-bis(diphosphate) 3'-pyrophosphohydrolase [Comamonas aquatica]|nr:bifunctional (p)ppGpp synthetase/guanosine-3',5'-bis(diphosphate) 3'-pyrophosphohydrolase [Comamonas aquatica]